MSNVAVTKSDLSSSVIAQLADVAVRGDEREAFVTFLIENILPKDRERIEPERLAVLVKGALSLLQKKKKGERKLEIFECREVERSPGDAPVSILQILSDNMPFLVESLMGEIAERDLKVEFVLHPVLHVIRDKDGAFEGFADRQKKEEKSSQESLILVELTGLDSDQERQELLHYLEDVLDQTESVVDDFPAMVQRLRDGIAALQANPGKLPDDETDEAIAFLKWLDDQNFVFLGMREFKLEGSAQEGELRPVEGSGLGILRDPNVFVLRRGLKKVHLTPEVRKFFFAPHPIIVTKANVTSKVHRRIHMDYIGLKTYRPDGSVGGELRIVGLFTAVAYTHAAARIPLIRRKLDYVVSRSGFAPDSHSGKALVFVLETYPRDELFQIDQDLLFQFAMEIQELHIRPAVRVISRIDEFDRFVSVIMYVPRSRFTTKVRLQIEEFLAKVYKGRISAFYPFFSERQLVRLHFIVGRYEGVTPRPEQLHLEREVEAIIQTWQDGLLAELRSKFSAKDAQRLAMIYDTAFPAGYTDSVLPDRAVSDIQRIEALGTDNPVLVSFYHVTDAPIGILGVTLYHIEESIPLSRRVPILENMGFSVIEERSHKITPYWDDQHPRFNVGIHDMVLSYQLDDRIDLDKVAGRLVDTFLHVWHGAAANDRYNQLVALAGATWREAAAIRAYGAYLRQVGVPFEPDYLSATLVRHKDVVRNLLQLFRVRFDPDLGADTEDRREKEGQIVEDIEQALAEIPSLDEDRILRHFQNLILSTLRTNFFQTDEQEQAPATLSYKIESSSVEGLPDPRPYAEIFVYSPRVEGIHLRGGAIARGGLRWSDRPQDFRTEILSLAKAQQVKNTVIIPTGAKGGFVPQNLPVEEGREAVLKEGVACYQLFIGSLIAITDTIREGGVHAPQRVVRYDSDDPYLVVAADKGTAAFSDFANEISQNRGFWLGDAFASGGSAGYDHKKMGITARGAWEAVKRHFREIDVDIQSEPIRVIGIGDMSGDVFGNGMLLSPCLKIVAAFDHRDIFIDPDPDPARSFEERKRLFALGRSSWQDYDRSIISAGGGIFSRSAKSVPLSAEIKSLTGLSQDEATPLDLIKMILRAEADLLWFGGIGTYVRGHHESDQEVGDRANDGLRITAEDLNVKVVGEGANLGLTQQARIAFALKGGAVNTDAIDNSAGVNSSDLEVNIKIAFAQLIEQDKLTLDDRNRVLEAMTDEVAERCLRNNYLQTLAISLEQKQGFSNLGFQRRLMRELEARGLLDRVIEYLPGDAELEERLSRREPLTRPELAVLLAYAKFDLTNALTDSDYLEEPYFERELYSYFPKTLTDKYADAVLTHRLKHEIIATQLANAVINRGGSTMVARLKEATGRHAIDIVQAFVVARAVFGFEKLYDDVDRLDTKVSGAAQLQLYSDLQNVLHRQTAWFLRNSYDDEHFAAVIETYSHGVEVFATGLEVIATPGEWQRVRDLKSNYEALGVPSDLSEQVASLQLLVHGADATLIARDAGIEVMKAGILLFLVRDYFDLSQFEERAVAFVSHDHFDKLAINSSLYSMVVAERALALKAAQRSGEPHAQFECWIDKNKAAVQRTKRALRDILDSGPLSVAKLSVAVSQLRDLSTA